MLDPDEAGLLVDAQHPRVLGLREDGVAAHVAVVLLRHPRLVGDVAVAQDREDRGRERLGRVVARQVLGAVGVDGVEPRRPVVRALVDGALVGDRLGVDVDDGLAVPLDDQPVALDDLTDDRGLDVPLNSEFSWPRIGSKTLEDGEPKLKSCFPAGATSLKREWLACAALE